MIRRARLLFAVCSVVLLACGSSPEPVYYALGPTGGAAQPGWARLVELRRLGLAGYLDRADIVSGVSDHRVRIESGQRWAEPLGDMMGRVLAQDLSQRLPGSTVFTESSVSLDPDATVEVDVQSLDIGDDGRLTMTAQVVIARGRER
ncbi:MAG: membrane integrity-associated transporter subunit PqiC, partial [Myxococcales bacterium]|nr:membrane integrity-associated transporter subunit PqiC [Myxococcales bacterium]